MRLLPNVESSLSWQWLHGCFRGSNERYNLRPWIEGIAKIAKRGTRICLKIGYCTQVQWFINKRCDLGCTSHLHTHSIYIFHEQTRACHVESLFSQCSFRAAWLMSDLRSSFRYGLPHLFWPAASETGIVPTRHEQHQRSARQREQAL